MLRHGEMSVRPVLPYICPALCGHLRTTSPGSAGIQDDPGVIFAAAAVREIGFHREGDR